MKNPRLLLAVGTLAVVIIVAVVVLAAGGSGDDKRVRMDDSDKPVRTVRARLTLEQFVQPDTGYPELLVSLPDKRLNTLATTGGKTSVVLRCVDKNGTQTIAQKTDWPLLEELGYPLPHIHQLAPPKVLDGVRACRLTGPGIDFAGRVPGRLPRAAQ